MVKTNTCVNIFMSCVLFSTEASKLNEDINENYEKIQYIILSPRKHYSVIYWLPQNKTYVDPLLRHLFAIASMQI